MSRFARIALVAAALVAGCVHAELATYTPALLFESSLTQNALLQKPLDVDPESPRELVASMASASNTQVSDNGRAVFVVLDSGLNTRMLAALTDKQVESLPKNRVEAVYTRGAEVQAFDLTLPASDGESLVEAVCTENNVNLVAAVSAQDMDEAIQVVNMLAGSCPNIPIVLTGASSPAQEVIEEDQSSEDTTIWPGPVAETIVSILAAIVPMAVVFHLLCSIRPVEDVEYPKHKIA